MATLTKAKVGGEDALKLLDNILRSKRISIITVEDGEILEDARGKFRKHEGIRGMSFTDCTTLTIQERMKIDCMLELRFKSSAICPKAARRKIQ